jgi:hypothetical protein
MRTNWAKSISRISSHLSSTQLYMNIILNTMWGGESLKQTAFSPLASLWGCMMSFCQSRDWRRSLLCKCVVNMRVRREGVSWCMDFFVHWWPRNARTSSASPVGRPLFPTCLLCCFTKRSVLHYGHYISYFNEARLSAMAIIKCE